jgi:hypothetical protein
MGNPLYIIQLPLSPELSTFEDNNYIRGFHSRLHFELMKCATSMQIAVELFLAAMTCQNLRSCHCA